MIYFTLGFSNIGIYLVSIIDKDLQYMCSTLTCIKKRRWKKNFLLSHGLKFERSQYLFFYAHCTKNMNIWNENKNLSNFFYVFYFIRLCLTCLYLKNNC